MPKNVGFLFGSVIFFIGVLMLALSVSRAIAQNWDLMTFVELISGVALILIGSRAIRSTQR